MEIHGPGGVNGPSRIDLHRAQAEKPAGLEPKHEVRDRAEISEEARLLAKLAEVPDVRADRVEELKRLIAANQLETPERIAGTVERLLEEL
ncbi:MAG: flagellar biosynthesis anti-sigma factor FlgM [Planctomycetes bacterium]|nr:flagellar biosynthesis anti-sigma factor FlgM [Planctomycetota bacterium]